LLVPAGNPAALGAALCRLLESNAIRSDFGARLRQRVVERYTRESIIERIAHVYDTITHHRIHGGRDAVAHS